LVFCDFIAHFVQPIMLLAVISHFLYLQLVLGSRVVRLDIVQEEKAESASWHLRKFAAVGSDWESFAEQVEKNKFRGSALLESNDTLPSPQTVWCPTEWRDRLSKEAPKVGEGSFGKVYVMNVECDSSQRTPVAVKVQKYERAVDQEVNYMEKLDHPNLIKAFAHARGPGTTDISILMESAAGGNFEKIKTASSADKARLLLEAFQGLVYMHSQALVHSDIKPDNILLSGDCSTGSCYSKVADFGLTVKTGKWEVAGTPYYLAPELIKTGQRTSSNDLWSMGVMIHELFKGVLPYNFKACFDVSCLQNKIRGATTYRKPIGKPVNAPLEELLEGLLEPNPKLRLTADGAASICENWWYSEVGSTEHNVPRPSLPSCWALCGRKACPQWPRPQTCSLDERSEAVCSGDAFTRAPTTERPKAFAPQVPQMPPVPATGLKTVVIKRLYGNEDVGISADNQGFVSKIIVNSLAYRSGLRSGDTIVTINGKQWTSLYPAEKHSAFKAMRVTLQVIPFSR
jgi:serine/threonine protein kinase